MNTMKKKYQTANIILHSYALYADSNIINRYCIR